MIATLSPTKRFTEITALRGRVDREAGIIYRTRILGEHSRNGRRYTHEAMRGSTHLYEGVRVFLNHPKRNEMGEDRPWQDWVGNLENVRFEAGGLVGDLRLLKKSKYFEAICEAAESDKHNRSFGLSHEADGPFHYDRASGEDVIESITRVDAVAIVTDPATTAGLFESSAPPLPDTSDEQFFAAVEELRAIRGCDELADKLGGMGEAVAMLVKGVEIDAPVQESYQQPSAEPVQEFWAPWAPSKLTRDDLRRFAHRLR